MKKLVTVVFSALIALVLSTAALADAALPNRLYVTYDAEKWIIAFLIALVIVAVVIIIGAIRYKKNNK